MHVRIDELGRPVIDGTTMKVIELISGVVAYGWNAEDLVRQYPSLTPAQVHGALTYYSDNQSAMDAELDRISQDLARACSDSPDSPLRQRLRSMGKIG
jgi:uncharacterized protein (DUF433 family)